MPARPTFGPAVLEAIRNKHYLWIRAGSGDHRFIPVWAVVIGKRVFVRGYYLRPGGWPQVFAEARSGAIRTGKSEPVMPVGAIRTRSERIKDAVDEAFAEKYTSPSSIQYVKGFRTRQRRDATIELFPSRHSGSQRVNKRD